MISKLVNDKGNRAGAVGTAAYLFVEQNGMENALFESVALWKDASKRADPKLQEIAHIVAHYARLAEGWCTYCRTKNRASINKELSDRKDKWSVILGHVSADELLSLANMMLYINVSLNLDEIKGLPTSEQLSYFITFKNMKTMNDKISKTLSG